jgi:hypothetical protein
MKWIVVTCHFLEILSVSLWVGGMLTIGALVAPVVFSNLPIDSAGEVMARIFHHFNREISLGLVIVLTASFLVRLLAEREGFVTPRKVKLWEGGLLLILCSIGIYVGTLLTPRIEAARATLKQPGSPAREAFGRLHQRSERLASAGLIAGVGLLWVKANALSRRRSGQ